MVPGPSPRASAGAGAHPAVHQRPLPHPRLPRRAHPLAGLRPLRRRRGEWHVDGLLRVGRPVPDLWRGEGGQLLARRALLDGPRRDLGRAGLPCGRGHGRPDAGTALPLLLPDVCVRPLHQDSHLAVFQLDVCQGRLRPRQRAAGGRDAGQIHGRRPELGRVRERPDPAGVPEEAAQLPRAHQRRRPGHAARRRQVRREAGVLRRKKRLPGGRACLVRRRREPHEFP